MVATSSKAERLAALLASVPGVFLAIDMPTPPTPRPHDQPPPAPRIRPVAV